MNFSDLKITIKSILTSSKVSLTPQDLLRDFKEIEGYDFPYQELGFSDFLQCLMSQEMSDIMEVQYERGVQVIIPVLSEKSKHINRLVKKQKSNPARSRPSQKPAKDERTVDENVELPGLGTGPYTWATEAEPRRYLLDENSSNSSHNWHEQNSISLSTVFHDLEQSIEDALLVSNQGEYFASAGYRNYLQQLGELLSITETTIRTIVDLVSDQNSLLKCCAISLKNSIYVLKHSFLLLHCVQAVECEVKLYIFQYGTDIFDNAVGIIDAIIKILSSDELVFSRKKELLSCVTRLYDRLPSLLPASSVQKGSDTSSLILQPITDKAPESTPKEEQIESFTEHETPPPAISSLKTNFTFFDLFNLTLPSKKVVNDAVNMNQYSTPKKEVHCKESCNLEPKNSPSTLSFETNIIFSNRSHGERYAAICRNVKAEINDFEIVKSAKLEFKCLICNIIVSSKDMEKHIVGEGHTQKKKIKNSKEDCKYKSNGEGSVKSKSDVSAPLKTASAMTIPASIKSNIKTPAQMISPSCKISFSERTKNERYKEICRNVKAEINDFEIVKSAKLEFKCLICNIIVSSKDMEKHIVGVGHTQKKKIKNSKEGCKYKSNGEGSVKSKSDVSAPLKTASAMTIPASIKSNIKTQAQMISPSCKISFSERTKNERYKEICRNVKAEINDFEIVKSAKLEFKCLICNIIVSSKDMEKHIVGVAHSQRKINNFKKSSSFRLDAEVSPNSVSKGSNVKSFDECEKFPSTSLPMRNDYTFSNPSHKERFEQICKNIKDEVNDFELVRGGKLKFKCLLCKLTVYAKEVEYHIELKNHRRKKNSYSVKNPIFESDLSALKATNVVGHESGGIKIRKPFAESENSTSAMLMTKVLSSSRSISRPNFTNEYVNIFSGINISEWRSRGFFFQEMVEADASKLNGKPRKLYDKFLSELQRQIIFFSINIGKHGAGFGITCNLCHKVIGKRSHATSPEHLIKMMKLYVDEKSQRFLSYSNEIPCTLCNIPLYKNECLWFDHFQSEFHNLKLQEFHATCNTADPQTLKEPLPDPSMVQECFLSEIEDGTVRTLEPENLFQDAAHFEASQFLSTAHKDQFRNLVKEINYQINFFTIDSHQRSEELTLTCKVCRVPVCVSEAKRHSEVQYHLLNLVSKCESKSILGVRGIDATDSTFLDFDEISKEYVCTLCDDPLSSNQDLWPIHFQSAVHLANANVRQRFQNSTLEENAASGCVDGRELFTDKRLF